MNVRQLVFYTVDALKNRGVRRNVQEISLVNNGCGDVAFQRESLLDNLLSHAKANVPFYRDVSTSEGLTGFPVISKAVVLANEMEFTADGVDKHKMHRATTSGSTGVPFAVYQNVGKRVRAAADAIYFGRKAGYDFGDRLYHMRIWTDRNKKGTLNRIARNLYPIDVSKFDAEKASDLLSHMAKQVGASALLGHASMFDFIASALQKKKYPNLKVSACVGQSEAFSQRTREILHEQLGIVPVGRYGAEELGIIAQQCDGLSERYLVNQASYVVELLSEDSDLPVPVGELGRIVVTDLFNYAQPLIRYDTGDYGVAESVVNDGEFVNILSRIEGRKTDKIYDTDDNPVSSFIAHRFWWRFPGILQYQIIQVSKGTYVIRLDVDHRFAHEGELKDELRGVFGQMADIEIEYAADGYTYSSGKRKAVVSKYKPPVNFS